MDKSVIDDKFNEIYDNTYENITNFVIKKCDDISSIQDITQEIYSEIYEILLNKGIEYINDYYKFTYHIAKKKIFKHYSIKLKIKNVIAFNRENGLDYDANFVEDIQDMNDYEEIYLERYNLSDVLNEIKGLEKITQKIIILYYLKDMKIKDIAVQLNLSENTVKTKLYRNINKLKDKYSKGGSANEYN